MEVLYFLDQLVSELSYLYHLVMTVLSFVFPRAMSFFLANSMIYLLLFVFKFSIYRNLS